MARKKRSLQPVAVADPTKKPKYRDPFQESIGRKVEEAGKKLEGQGRNILYGLAALLVLGIAVWIFYSWNARNNAAAQAALGKAIETSQSLVNESPPAVGSARKTFKTEKERADAAVAEFNAVAEKFGGDVGRKARYFSAVTKLTVDRQTGIAELEGMVGSNDEVGKLARFALAQTRADDGRLDEAVTLYQELVAMPDSMIAKDTLNFEIAKIYEKQDKKAEAAELYFGIAKGAAEAKDLEGKPVPLSPTAQTAKDKVKELDPEKAKEIPEPAPDLPPGF